MNKFIAFLLTLSLATNEAVAMSHKKNVKNRSNKTLRGTKRKVARSGKKIFAILLKPFQLIGSTGQRIAQNSRADELQINRITEEERTRYIGDRTLVPLPTSKALKIDYRLEETKRYCRACLANPLLNVAEEYYKEFHKPLKISGALRSTEQQKATAKNNINAAPPDGPDASMHLRGNTIDISRKLLTREQTKWLQEKFIKLHDQGMVDAVQENNWKTGGYCFHVTFWCSNSGPKKQSIEDVALATLQK